MKPEGHLGKAKEMMNVIQTRWNIYFTAEKDQLTVASHYLQLYRGAKDSKLKSRVRNYLSVLSVYLRDKERFTRDQYKAYGTTIKELQSEYAKDRRNKKLRSELIKLGKAQAELGRELKTIDKYKAAFRETIDCAYII